MECFFKHLQKPVGLEAEMLHRLFILFFAEMIRKTFIEFHIGNDSKNGIYLVQNIK